MVGAILGVVFHDEQGGILPELALAECLDDASQSQIIVGHHGGRRRFADPRAGGVVVG